MRRSAADASFRYAKSGSTGAKRDCASRSAAGISPLSRSSSAVSTLPCATCAAYVDDRRCACQHLTECTLLLVRHHDCGLTRMSRASFGALLTLSYDAAAAAAAELRRAVDGARLHRERGVSRLANDAISAALAGSLI